MAPWWDRRRVRPLQYYNINIPASQTRNTAFVWQELSGYVGPLGAHSEASFREVVDKARARLCAGRSVWKCPSGDDKPYPFKHGLTELAIELKSADEWIAAQPPMRRTADGGFLVVSFAMASEQPELCQAMVDAVRAGPSERIDKWSEWDS